MPIATLDAATAERVAVLAVAVLVGETSRAAAAIRRAVRPERRALAFAIFVAFVANASLLIAAVSSARTVTAFGANLEAAVGQRITGEARRAVLGGDALDAAMAIHVAARSAARPAVVVARAFVASSLDAVQRRRARQLPAAAFHGAAARATAARATSARARLTARARCGRIAASAGHVEIEAAVASDARHQQRHEDEAFPQQYAQRSLARRCASVAPKPCG